MVFLTAAMFGNEFSEDQRPITYLHGYPLHAATLIVAVYVATMLATTILMAMGQAGIAQWMVFDTAQVLHGSKVWTFLTYGLWNPPSLGFVIDMFMIAWFGREVERFFGRRIFLRFYALLYLLQPVLYALLGLLFRPVTVGGETGAFALFIAFATLYPNVALFFNILAKWLAAILVGIYTAIALSSQDVVTLVTLWASTGFAYSVVRTNRGGFRCPSFNLARAKKPKLRVLPTPTSAASPRTVRPDQNEADIDALLDKIARTGMSSLTDKEKARLEEARVALIRKEKP